MKRIFLVLCLFLSTQAYGQTLLKQSTATEVQVSFFDATDGITPETALTVTNFDCSLVKHADASSATTALTVTAAGGGVNDAGHLNDGTYFLELTASNTDTVGRLFLKCLCTGAAPFEKWFTVVPSGTWSGLISTGLGSSTTFWNTLLTSLTDADGIGFLLKTQLDKKVSEGGGKLRVRTAQAGGNNTITLDTDASSTNDFYKYAVVSLISGTGEGQWAVVTAYDGTTKVATVICQNTSTGNWTVNPSSDTVFVLSGDRR